MLAVFFHIVTTLRAAGEPHRYRGTASALDVVPNNRGAKQAAARAGVVLEYIVEHAGRRAWRGGGRDRAVVCVALFAKSLMIGVAHLLRGESVRNLDYDLSGAMRAEALFACILVLDLEVVPVRTLDADAHA